jgi:hypothetical protein
MDTEMMGQNLAAVGLKGRLKSFQTTLQEVFTAFCSV